MKEVVLRLVLAYRRELELYGEILDLAREGQASARACSALTHLHAINERKQSHLQEIESIERDIGDDKSVWRASKNTDHGSREIETLLAKLTERIERIIEAERETDRWIISGAGLAGVAQESAASGTTPW